MPRPPLVDDQTVLTRLATVFRVTGYEGASVAALAEGTGLKSASLYHRFPEGKPGMATAVLDHVEEQFTAVLEPVRRAEDPAEGVRAMARGLASFYDDGRLACVLDTMTLRGAPDEVRQRAATLARAWLDAMAGAATRSGASEAEAQRRARAALVRVEGSLVLSRVLDDPTEFAAVLDELPALLTG